MTDGLIDIKGIDKAVLLAGLFNHAQPQGFGFLVATNELMSVEEARTISFDMQIAYMGGGAYYDYVKGRSMKVALGGDTLDPTLYDRDNGQGMAEKVVRTIRESE